MCAVVHCITWPVSILQPAHSLRRYSLPGPHLQCSLGDKFSHLYHCNDEQGLRGEWAFRLEQKHKARDLPVDVAGENLLF